MSDVWVVAAVAWEESEIHGMFSTEEAAIAHARALHEREGRKRFPSWGHVVTKHALDPEVGTIAEGQEVDWELPRLGAYYRPMHVASVGIPSP